MIRVIIEFDGETLKVNGNTINTSQKESEKKAPVKLKVAKEKKCTSCGKTFSPHSNRQVRCSKKCGLITRDQISKNKEKKIKPIITSLDGKIKETSYITDDQIIHSKDHPYGR